MNIGTLPGFGKRRTGGVKRVQSGEVLAAGTVNIAPVRQNKTFVLSASKGSAGYVAARGSVAMTPSGGLIAKEGGGSSTGSGSFATYNGSITGGTTDLTVAEYSAKLTSPTTIYCDGPCHWQVVENY